MKSIKEQLNKKVKIMPAKGRDEKGKVHDLLVKWELDSEGAYHFRGIVSTLN